MTLSKEEKWLPIKDYPKYEISNQGQVRNINTGRILKYRNGHEYPSVAIYDENGRKDILIHKVEMNTFYNKKCCKLDINHIDGVKNNNNIDNLEWCTISENIKHAYNTGLKKPSGPNGPYKVKIIETGEVYDSVRDCARAINGSQAHISRCLNGEYKQYRGLHFIRVL